MSYKCGLFLNMLSQNRSSMRPDERSSQDILTMPHGTPENNEASSAGEFDAGVITQIRIAGFNREASATPR